MSTKAQHQQARGGPRNFANERERGRTQSVNGAFQHLRGLIPTEPVDRLVLSPLGGRDFSVFREP